MVSPAQFAEFIALIQTKYGTESNSVRRAERLAYPCRITITLGNNNEAGESFSVDVRDISARGMSFVHERELLPGTNFVVKLESPEGTPVSILSTIVHVRKQDESSHVFGAEFICVLGQKDDLHVEPGLEDLMRIRSSILD